MREQLTIEVLEALVGFDTHEPQLEPRVGRMGRSLSRPTRRGA